jgi:hypothetical protein
LLLPINASAVEQAVSAHTAKSSGVIVVADPMMTVVSPTVYFSSPIEIAVGEDGKILSLRTLSIFPTTESRGVAK